MGNQIHLEQMMKITHILKIGRRSEESSFAVWELISKATGQAVDDGVANAEDCELEELEDQILDEACGNSGLRVLEVEVQYLK